MELAPVQCRPQVVLEVPDLRLLDVDVRELRLKLRLTGRGVAGGFALVLPAGFLVIYVGLPATVGAPAQLQVRRACCSGVISFPRFDASALSRRRIAINGRLIRAMNIPTNGRFGTSGEAQG